MNCRKNFCAFASTTVEYMQVNTVAELIYWSYANLAMAHSAVERGVDTYDRTSFMIRSRLYKGLTNGTMQIRSFFDDERYKLENGTHCVYCGSQTNISVDHVFAKAHEGVDSSDNLVCCCSLSILLGIRNPGYFETIENSPGPTAPGVLASNGNRR